MSSHAWVILLYVGMKCFKSGTSVSYCFVIYRYTIIVSRNRWYIGYFRTCCLLVRLFAFFLLVISSFFFSASALSRHARFISTILVPSKETAGAFYLGALSLICNGSSRRAPTGSSKPLGLFLKALCSLRGQWKVAEMKPSFSIVVLVNSWWSRLWDWYDSSYVLETSFIHAKPGLN